MVENRIRRATLRGPLTPPPAALEAVEGTLYLGASPTLRFVYPEDEIPLVCPEISGPLQFVPSRLTLERTERHYRSGHVAKVSSLYFFDRSDRTRLLLEEVNVIGWSGQGGGSGSFRSLLTPYARLLAAEYSLPLEEPEDYERLIEVEAIYPEPPF